MLTITRAHIAEMIYTQVGLSRNESADLLEDVLDRMRHELQNGESVKISGFGTFSVRQKGRRIGRNPKTGRGSADPAAPGSGVPAQPCAEGPCQRHDARGTEEMNDWTARSLSAIPSGAAAHGLHAVRDDL